MKFNINNEVRVKLNDQGRKIYADRYSAIGSFQTKAKEDAEGWSVWQLWYLMAVFGPHISLSQTPPFETEIEIMENQS